MKNIFKRHKHVWEYSTITNQEQCACGKKSGRVMYWADSRSEANSLLLRLAFQVIAFPNLRVNMKKEGDKWKVWIDDRL